MFSKKADAKTGATGTRSDIVVHTIPDMFYGGKNPEIYTNPTPTTPHTHIKPQAPVKKPPVHSHHVHLFVGIGVLVLCVIAGVSFYYIQKYVMSDSPDVSMDTPDVVDATPPVVVSPIPVVNPTTTIVIASSSPSVDPNTNISDVVFVFPVFGLFDSPDLDADGLTDREEELYGTDPGIWDTDEDGYYDGLEVQNLYSPTQKSPVKIVGDQNVRQYVHPQFGYTFLYPAAWQVAMVDTEGEQVLISAQSGEYIEIIRSPRIANENFVSWYARVIGSSARFTDFAPEKNRFAFEYVRRPDWLAGFFESPDAVYTLIYHTGNNQDVSYRRSMSLVVQSFVPFGTAAPLPEQDVLPSGNTSSP